jgi:predicted GNAT superfamily acetyltransferase
LSAPAQGGFTIRDITDRQELERCVEIQERVWGDGFDERVPAALLWVATRTGGVVAGAFAQDGALAGFVFGISGFRDGRPIHWSDMLAVLPEARGAGLGRRLKLHQRDCLLGRGIHNVFWTFDPLESRNAFLNFARLGITATEYVRDCYGESSSPLHHGLGTDRLVAHWALASPRVRRRMDGAERPPAASEVGRVPVINGDPARPRLDLAAPRLRLRIPADIQALKAADPAAARRWREWTRPAFEAYLGRGYEVVELIRESEATSSYILALRTGLS